MNNNPLISVIIPVYNTEKYLEACLNSIVNQTYRNLEIILIDDGSTDNSPNICDKYAEMDSRIKVIHKKNEGVSKARNTGLLYATGDYFHFPDSDDYLEIDAYEYLLQLLNEKNCDAVAFEHYITYSDREIIHKLDESFYGLFDNEKTQIKLFKGSQFCCNKLYKKELVNDIKFREDIFRGEDTLFSASVLLNAKKVWFDSRPLYHYVQSEESACRGEFRRSQFTVLMLYDAYRKIYTEQYNCVWPYFLLYMQDILISLYYDIWSDVNSNKYSNQKKDFYSAICIHYREIKPANIISKKQKLKFILFKISPRIFCIIHRRIHNL